jgi:predicted hydrolase (HD superfamily)
MAPRSIKKKLKDKAFAAAVSREDIAVGTEELGIDLDTHIANVIAGMTREADRLGF